MIKDILGREIKVGDLVSYISSSHYKNIHVGEVVGFTPTGVRLLKFRSKQMSTQPFHRSSHQVCKLSMEGIE